MSGLSAGEGEAPFTPEELAGFAAMQAPVVRSRTPDRTGPAPPPATARTTAPPRAPDRTGATPASAEAMVLASEFFAARAAARKRYKTRHPDRVKASRHRGRTSKQIPNIPPPTFIGCDCEGGGTDAIGRQLLLLLRIGERELYTGKHLSTLECLDFICDSTPDGTLVGFAFMGYDVTMILRDLSSERRAHLLSEKERGAGKSVYTWIAGTGAVTGFGIDFLPRNHFKVCRAVSCLARDGKTVTWKSVPGTSRTIFETFGFFQAKFTGALKMYGLGHSDMAMLEKNKGERGSWTELTEENRHYCHVECRLLAEMMDNLAANCIAAGIRPATWNGAGKLAARAHEMHHTLTRDEVVALLDPGLLSMARHAYYGGRFEITHVGEVPGPIYTYDINSAYPAAMTRLPCLKHGEWVGCDRGQLDVVRASTPDALFVASCSFTHELPDGGTATVCGLPFRDTHGGICFPSQASGVYWSPEIRSAELLGAKVTCHSGWLCSKRCDCEPFAWVKDLYARRLELGKSQAGYPIKLAVNSLYGKLAQRIGRARWKNFVWAGLITSITRASLNIAAAMAGPGGKGVVMLATDGIFTTVPLSLDVGNQLGQWESKVIPRLFTVMPGIYWGASRPKTRGVNDAKLSDVIPVFEERWRDFGIAHRRAEEEFEWYPEPPFVKVPVDQFTGLKLAQARGKPETAGKWISSPPDCAHDTADCHCRRLSFDWTAKRDDGAWLTAGCYLTRPHEGDASWQSMPHAADAPLNGMLDESRLEAEDQPDKVTFCPPLHDEED